MVRFLSLLLLWVALFVLAADAQPLSTSEVEALGSGSGPDDRVGPVDIPELEISVDLPIEIRDATSASLLMKATQKIIEATQIEVPPGARGIQLFEVVQETLNNNYTLQSARINPMTAETRITVEQSAFDPIAFANVIFQRNKEPETGLNDFGQPILSQRVVRTRALGDGRSVQGAGVRQRFDIGTEIQAEISARRQLTEIGGIPSEFGDFVSRTDGYRTEARFSVIQPLLEGYGRTANLAFVRIAYNGKLINEVQLRLITQNLIARAHTAYWNLVFSRVNLAIGQQSLTLAADLLRENRIRYKYGDLIAVEVYEAQAGVKAREQEVIVAENSLNNSMDDLRELMAFERAGSDWEVDLIPTDAPHFYPVQIDSDVSLQIALEESPEIQLAQLFIQQAREGRVIAYDAYRPRLDVIAELSERGLGDTLGKSFNILDDSEFTSYSIGAQFETPIYRRGERANIRAADLSIQKRKLDLDDVKQQVTYSHREAVRNIEDLIRAIAAAKATVVAEGNRLENSRIGHEQGVTTSNDLLEAQEDYAQAQVEEIRRVVDYYISLIQLERIRGTLLDSLGFEFVDQRNEVR